MNVKNITKAKKKEMFKKLTHDYPFYFESSISLIEKFLSAA